MTKDKGQKTKIKVLLADDHALFREGLRALLEDQADINVIGEAEDGLQVEKLAQLLQPDIILMDINMPIIDGVEATQSILEHNKNINIIILTMHRQDEYIVEALKAGAKAYLLKDTRSKRLLEVIRRVSTGETVIEPDMTAYLLTELKRMSKQIKEVGTATDNLTAQEQHILSYLTQGASNKEIAEQMHLAERTIKNYLSIIFQKMQVNNRTEAAMKAVKEGLIDAV